MDNEVLKIISYLTLLELDIKTQISKEMVIDAYRKLAQIYHPDVANSRYKDGKKFIELQEAKDYLINNMSYVNSLIRTGFSSATTNTKSSNDYAYEKWKQEEEFRRRQQEEERLRKQREEEEKRRKEAEEKRRREEEQRRQQEELKRKKLQERKERALSDATNLSKNIKKENYFDEDYKKINQFIMLFYNYINENRYSSITDIDEKYNALLKSISDIKTIEQVNRAKKVKKITIASLTSAAVFILFMVILINVIIPSSKYNKAVNYYKSGEYSQAETLFNQLGDYKDAKSYLEGIEDSKNCEKIANNFINSNEKDYKKIIKSMSNSGGNVSFTYQIDGGTLTNSYQNGYYESSYRNGYEFSSWSILESSFDRINNTLNLKLKANYTPIAYLIEYDLCGGQTTNANTYNIETETFVLNNPTKEGYTFIGWNYYGSSTIVKDLAIEKGSTGDRIIIANYVANKYTLSFNTFSEEEVIDIEVTYGSNYNLPVLPKEGYVFSWYYGDQKIDNNGVWNISKDLTLEAKWSIINYSIKYNLNGGNASNYTSYTINDSFKINNPTRLGYSFSGWTYDGQNTPVLNAEITEGSTGNKEYVAQWAIINYDVEYVLDNTMILDNSPKTYNAEKNIVFSAPSKTGYHFDGWYLEQNHKTKITSTMNYYENLTVYPKFTPNQYTIKTNGNYTINFYKNDGTNGLYTTKNVKGGESLSYPDIPKRSGYCFRGWFTTPNCSDVFCFSNLINESIDLYAGWQEIPNGINLINPDGFSVDSSNATNYKAGVYYDNTYGIYLACSNYEDTSFNIGGYIRQWGKVIVKVWNLTKNSECIFECSGSSVTSKFYGYDINVDPGSVIIIGLCGFGCETDVSLSIGNFTNPQPAIVVGKDRTIYVNYDSMFNIPVDEISGYTFVGYCDKNGVLKTDSSGISLEKYKYTSDIVFYEVWEKE